MIRGGSAPISHPTSSAPAWIGGFVSHCGWNSVLESIWCGVPIVAWPLYAEQQLNVFQLVVDIGIAVPIEIDYGTDMSLVGNKMMVKADEIDRAIRRLMSDGDMRKKVKEMKKKSSLAVSKGGSSHESIRCFIDNVVIN
ncbi:UDP-glycosyltransferase 71E1 [Tanacetum coccineum]